jgi:hypothetical protein
MLHKSPEVPSRQLQVQLDKPLGTHEPPLWHGLPEQWLLELIILKRMQNLWLP